MADWIKLSASVCEQDNGCWGQGRKQRGQDLSFKENIDLGVTFEELVKFGQS